jgi:chemotaxis protein CheC
MEEFQMQFENTLQEICKASAMKAAAAMSKFLKTPLKIDIKPIKIDSIQNIDLPNHFNESTVGLFVPIDSTIKGGSLMISSKKSALATCDLMLSRTEGHTNNITEVEESALKELANIALGNFLAPFAHSLLLGSLLHKPATYEYNTSNVIINHTRTILSDTIGKNAVLNISFSYEHANIKGDVNIVLDEQKINSLLQIIKAISNG